MNGYFKAKLVSFRKISVLAFTDVTRPEKITVSLYKNGHLLKKDVIGKFVSVNSIYLFDIYLKDDYELTANYYLLLNDLYPLSIDTSEAIYFNDFDDKYYYDGEDLGANYHKEATEFVVWTPLSISTSLKLVDKNNKTTIYPMTCEGRGVYRIKIAGDLLNYKYHYIVNNNGIISEANDIYAKTVSLNSEYSIVSDLAFLKQKERIVPKTKINNYVDAIIYETHIRDINEDNANDVVNKGKYVGFVEVGRKSLGSHPAGLDYIKYLGVTHVQLQPVLDFNSLDDVDNKKWYNWGYDPLSFFALEGSYSLHPEDPIERIKEFRFLVDELHKNDLRIILDVVYNHIYQYENSDFEKLVPHYYFRRRKNNHFLANASGCGDDFASERKMARKIILDSVKYLIKSFDLDGLRFDLMGLLDIETVKSCYQEAKKIKNDIMFYGEGWNMGEELPFAKRANKDNYASLPEFAFFNDFYRDIIKGPGGYNLKERGFICGNVSYAYGVDFAFHGSVLPLSYKPMFDTANQSLNYIECHDNHTLFDKLLISNEGEEEKTLLDRVTLANSILLLSFGIPFIHMGQEIGLSKDGLDNTYNVTKINNLDYRLVDERFDMVNRFRLMSALRKKLRYLTLFKPEEMENFFQISHWDNGVYCLLAKEKNIIANEKEFVILINPTEEKISFELDDYYTVVEGVGKETEINIKNGFLPGCNLMLLFK